VENTSLAELRADDRNGLSDLRCIAPMSGFKEPFNKR
jgi:hypothetical protein